MSRSRVPRRENRLPTAFATDRRRLRLGESHVGKLVSNDCHLIAVVAIPRPFCFREELRCLF